MTDTIIDSLDQGWLLRLGLDLLGVPEATDFVLNDWKSNRRTPLRTYRPYFIHMLSINIFFALVLQTQLLSKVKASHQIDLAYLYYLPFCAVFSSRDNFHVQVAPLFMHPAQQFVHGDDLKVDLKRLHARYSEFPLETREKGLYTFAQFPPDDSSFLTTHLWDAICRIGAKTRRTSWKCRRRSEKPSPSLCGSISKRPLRRMPAQ